MFNPQPLLDAAPAVQIHALSACLAIALTPITLFRKRRDRLHKIFGYGWSLAMFLTAASAMFIGEFGFIGHFGPIHLFCIFTFWGLYDGISAAVRRDFAAHQRNMRQLAFGALGIAGTLSFLPGRRMNSLFFSGMEEMGFAFVLALFAICVILFGGLGRRKSPA